MRRAALPARPLPLRPRPYDPGRIHAGSSTGGPQCYTLTTLGPGREVLDRRVIRFGTKPAPARRAGELHPMLGGLMLLGLFAIATLAIVASGL